MTCLHVANVGIWASQDTAKPITWGINTTGPAGVPVPVVLTAATCNQRAAYYPDDSPLLFPDGWWMEWPRAFGGSFGTASAFEITVPDGTPAGIVFTDGTNTYTTVGGANQNKIFH